MTFTASSTAQGYAFTYNKTLVTATATATGISEISYDEALVQAIELAQDEANVTALYDANLINQAVSETQQLLNYNVTQISSPPDLTFYYSTNPSVCENTITPLGSTSILQTIYTLLCSDNNLQNPIGTFTVSRTIFDINNSNINNIYKTSGITSFFLPNGLITVVAYAPLVKNNTGRFVTIPGKYLYQIASGTGEYLNKSGILEYIYDNDSYSRTINVYFNNY